MERLINQNSYQPKQAKYRGLKQLDEEAMKNFNQNNKLLNQYDGLSLEKLWTYTCALTKDRNISCMSWNKKNKDILAVGYGKFEYNDDPTGLVCCWSLKNPEFPERFYKTDSGVTSLAFSQKHSNLIAVGLFNGNILVFDVRNNNTAPLLNTNESEHKHLSPVWNLKWTDRDRSNSTGDGEEMEVLMSISSDGRVTQWMIRKGFESTG
jgi:WD40 repeat protein